MIRADDVHLESEQVFVMGILFVALAGAAVLLCFLARVSGKATFGWDDLWVILGSVLYWVHESLQLWGS